MQSDLFHLFLMPKRDKQAHVFKFRSKTRWRDAAPQNQIMKKALFGKYFRIIAEKCCANNLHRIQTRSSCRHKLNDSECSLRLNVNVFYLIIPVISII